MMGLDATFLSQGHVALGLGSEFRFVKAVPAGVTLSLEWTVRTIEHKASLAGDVVSVEGRAVDDAGTVYVTATGRNLLRRQRSSLDPGS
jgi:acyl dehydratase